MNYQETIDYLYNNTPMFQQIGTKAYKEGLENTIAIDHRLNHPHKIYRTLHIAGTNGKGSISHILSSILKHSGYSSGLYTSPHLNRFNERLKINGEMVPDQFVVDFVEEHKSFMEEIQASFFELTTGMAFKWFAQKKVDIAVIEAGLGGRLDCTNIIHPDLCIITNISFDHMSLLGNTLPAIAREKAGIIKPGIPVVVGEASGEVKQVFMEEAKIKNAPILFAEEEKPIIKSTLMPSGQWKFDVKDYPGLIGQLGGFAQEKNAATVLCAVNQLKKQGYIIPDEAVYKGFANVVEDTGLLGRWQMIQNQPKIVFDTGHNVGGMEYIARQLKAETYDKLHIVIGMVNDKDISAVLQLLPQNAVYYFTQASIPRALDAEELKNKAVEFGLTGKSYSTVKEAFFAAKASAKENDFIFVGGSTFVVADALDIINK